MQRALTADPAAAVAAGAAPTPPPPPKHTLSGLLREWALGLGPEAVVTRHGRCVLRLLLCATSAAFAYNGSLTQSASPCATCCRTFILQSTSTADGYAHTLRPRWSLSSCWRLLCSLPPPLHSNWQQQHGPPTHST